MTIPSRAKQIEWLSAQLDKGAEEGEGLERFAGRIIDSIHDAMLSALEPGQPPMHVGMAFKSPFTTKVHFVGWQEGERLWIISETCNFGWFGHIDSPFWKYIEESPDRRRGKKDENGVVQPPEGPRPGSPGNNPDWGVGDLVSRSQRIYKGRIVATGDKCVLLESITTGQIQPESNENMSRYYRRES